MPFLFRPDPVPQAASPVPVAAAAAASACAGRAYPRLFQITFDNSKSRLRNPQMRAQMHQKQTLWGAQFPPTDALPSGSIVLADGVFFVRLDELEEYFAARGTYTMTWLDEDGSKAGS